MDNLCSYKKCKRVAEYNTVFGDFCKIHLKVLKKNKRIKDLKEKKIKISNIEKKLINFSKYNPMFTIKFKGGKK